MPAERLPMRKGREVLRLKYAGGASARVIAQSVGIGRSAVAEYIRRAAVIGVTWPIPAELDDAALERKLFAPAGSGDSGDSPSGLSQVVVTSVGNWRGEGLGLIEKAG